MSALKRHRYEDSTDGLTDRLIDEFRLDEFRRLTRLEFYRNLKRRAPVQLVSIPSYVQVVKRRYMCASGNEARKILAQIEGFPTWEALMRAALSGEASRF